MNANARCDELQPGVVVDEVPTVNELREFGVFGVARAAAYILGVLIPAGGCMILLGLAVGGQLPGWWALVGICGLVAGVLSHGLATAIFDLADASLERRQRGE